MGKIKKLAHYSPFIIIPLVAILTATIGSIFTLQGMGWYSTISKPSWTPGGNIIGLVWTIIYTLCTASALLTWYSKMPEKRRQMTLFIFFINAILNALWTFIFFSIHAISWSLAEMVILNLTTILLISIIWPFSRLGALLLAPYVAWVSFATYLAYSVLILN